MAVFFFLLGIVQCFVLWRLARTGQRLIHLGQLDKERSMLTPAGGWPVCAVIVPVAGNHPNTIAALASLAGQNYPDFTLYLVTASYEDAATPVIEALARMYGNVVHIVAGEATKCGQKNYNSLAGVASARPDAPVLAFCDSTHVADSDFLRCLVSPIATGEAMFAAGYHEVQPQDNKIITLAYALSVLFMRFLQGSPGLTQPWGGAMAMSREGFAEYEVARLWASNVVDDCSLAALLIAKKVPVSLCPGAILKTSASNHALSVWEAWLVRQILFLKFCIPSQWLALGLVCLLMAAPPIWCIGACLDGLVNIGTPTAPFLALCWFCGLGWTIGNWRQFLKTPPPISHWLAAFFCASFMFLAVYISTLVKRSILWNNILYNVGKGGRILAIRK